jgi:hypothetical protein
MGRRPRADHVALKCRLNKQQFATPGRQTSSADASKAGGPRPFEHQPARRRILNAAREAAALPARLHLERGNVRVIRKVITPI